MESDTATDPEVGKGNLNQDHTSKSSEGKADSSKKGVPTIKASGRGRVAHLGARNRENSESQDEEGNNRPKSVSLEKHPAEISPRRSSTAVERGRKVNRDEKLIPEIGVTDTKSKKVENVSFGKITGDHKRTVKSSKGRKGNEEAQKRQRRRDTIRHQLVDGEKLKAEIYREYVGRRNGMDFGKRRGRKHSNATKPPPQANTPPQQPNTKQAIPAPKPNNTKEIPREMKKRTKAKIRVSTLPKIKDKGISTIPETDEPPKSTSKKKAHFTYLANQTGKKGTFREVFDLFDSNGGGTIDAHELDLTLRSVKICLTREEIGEVVNMIDKDGNGEIDFHEFLQLMTNTERFLASLTKRHDVEDVGESDIKNREHLLFNALTEFMKSSALHAVDEIVGYYSTKYKRVQTPHVVNHYAAGARLIGLTERQLKEHLEHLKATHSDSCLESPYAQPLHFVTSEAVLHKQHGRKQGRIRLKVKLDCGKHNSSRLAGSRMCSLQDGEQPECHRGGYNRGWISQRTEHIEVRLPYSCLRALEPFDSLTADDLPVIRTAVNTATDAYCLKRHLEQRTNNLIHWKTLEAELISPNLLRKHYRDVFSHYAHIKPHMLGVCPM